MSNKSIKAVYDKYLLGRQFTVEGSFKPDIWTFEEYINMHVIKISVLNGESNKVEYYSVSIEDITNMFRRGMWRLA